MQGDSQGAPPQRKTTKDEDIFDDALSALVNLGYPMKSARKALENARSHLKEMNLEGLITEALRSLA